jgi:hypothetical protein
MFSNPQGILANSLNKRKGIQKHFYYMQYRGKLLELIGTFRRPMDYEVNISQIE